MIRQKTKMYSIYYKHYADGWCADHRFPLDSAIFMAKEYHRNDVLVAIVPDLADPAPYLKIAEMFA